ncbi:MMPL family transporter, partial [Myxococcota bacterium]|nr:MMPL family transporter [Myxococcota bacterium]
NLAFIEDLHFQLEEINGVEEVQSIITASTITGFGDELVVGPISEELPTTDAEAEAFARAAQNDRFFQGNFISENGHTTVLALRIDRSFRDAKQRNPIVQNAQTIAEKMVEGRRLKLIVGGIPLAQWIYTGKMIDDFSIFTVISVLLLAVMLFFLFRSFVGMMLPLIVVMVATTWTMATMALTGESINMLSTAIPTLMLVIGIADGIHLISDYAQRQADGEPPLEAIQHTFVTLGRACLLTTFTTAVGFGSLASARIGTVRNFGIYSAIGIGFAFVANMVLIPIGLAYLQPKLGRRELDRKMNKLTRVLDFLAEITVNHPWKSLAFALPIVIGIGVGGFLVDVESRLFEEISDDDPVVVANRELEKDLPGVAAYAIDIETEPGLVTDPVFLKALDELETIAGNFDAVGKVMGLTDIIKHFNQAMHENDPAYYRVPDDKRLIAQYLLLAEGDMTDRLVNAEHSRTRIWMRGPEIVTSEWENARATLESQIKDLPLNAKAVVTGSSSMAHRALGSIVRDVLVSLLGAVLVILLLMSLLFRSFKIGLLSMIPNLIPLFMTLGVMGYMGIHLRTSTVVIPSISLGLAVDDTIHFLVRYRRQRAAGLSESDAIRKTMHLAGRPIVYTSFLLIGGFWILILSDFNSTQDVGLLGGVTLLSALFADLLILPALLRVIPHGNGHGKSYRKSDLSSSAV